MRLSILLPRHWPGAWARVVIVVIIFILVSRWEPGALIPLGLGGSIGGWLAVAPTRPLGTDTAIPRVP